VTTCKKCWNYEIHLKEALEELISLRAANELLQTELLSYATPKNTWKINQDSNRNNSDVDVNGERSLITTKYHMVKPRKSNQSANVKTDQFTKTANCYTPLTKLHADNVGAMPVIVNGDISTKRNAKVNNRNTS
jgi:hypothetical protein